MLNQTKACDQPGIFSLFYQYSWFFLLFSFQYLPLPLEHPHFWAPGMGVGHFCTGALQVALWTKYIWPVALPNQHPGSPEKMGQKSFHCALCTVGQEKKGGCWGWGHCRREEKPLFLWTHQPVLITWHAQRPLAYDVHFFFSWPAGINVFTKIWL